MSDTTAKLALPYIAASQAQKHVTHNEALRRLDTLVQASAISKDLATPPASPQNGDCYIVPAGATGDWAARSDMLAVWEDTAWQFYPPNEGWTVWVSDRDALWSFDGSSWAETAPPESFQNLPLLGVNTTADSTNRLSVSSAATLLNNEGAGHQLKINKAADSDTASLLFQSNWTGHAEMGLAGDTDFSVKTSDGSSWFTSLTCSSVNGRVGFPAGISGRIPVFDTGNSVFLGEGAGASDSLTANNNNAFVGYFAGWANTAGQYNIALGFSALRNNATGGANTAIGAQALFSNTSVSYNTACGYRALYANTTGYDNSAFGASALTANTTGYANSAQGRNALLNNTTGSSNAAIGTYSLYSNTTGDNNTGIGNAALFANATGSNNTANGQNALRWTTTGADNTSYSNCSGLGYNTRVSGSNQVQLGDSSTTTYAYGAVQDRSDARDKADIRDTVLGLDFIRRLRPVDFRWDMRDDYFDEVEETDPATGETVTRLVRVAKDGSRKRKRFHHGLIAQEVAAVLRETGLDFGGYQDHNYSGNGEDVLSIGYTELIAPLIRAIQELAAEVEALRAGV